MDLKPPIELEFEKIMRPFLRGPTTGPNAWRSRTSFQKNRNAIMMMSKKTEKEELIKWVKEFHKDPLGYTNVSLGKYLLPETDMVKVMALGYISDMSEVKRLHNEENISIEWSQIPFLITEEEWTTGICTLGLGDIGDEES